MKIKGVYGNEGDKQIQFDGETNDQCNKNQNQTYSKCLNLY